MNEARKEINVIIPVAITAFLYNFIYFNMYINRVIVIAFIVAYNILAIYIPSWYVLGNMSMVYRSSNSVAKIECSVIVCCILIVIFTILTIFRFQKYDVISTRSIIGIEV